MDVTKGVGDSHMQTTDPFVPLGTAAKRVVRGLTEKQRAARKGKLTASRISVLMTGDAEGIHRLWRQMIGQEYEPDLRDVWPVQLGLTTEELNFEWAERKLGEQIVDRGVFVQHPRFEWAGATLDGVLRETNRPIEAKHCGGNEPMETIINRYQPQLQWIMECAQWNIDEIALSVIFGANEPIIEWIPRDFAYATEMLDRGAQFMRHVRDWTPPVDLPPIQPPVTPGKRYDMTPSNEWGDLSFAWLDTRAAAETFNTAAKRLKELVPVDAKECRGHGVIAKRDRAGRITLKGEQS